MIWAVPADVLAAECDRLLDFGRHFPHPRGRRGLAGRRGRPDLTRPVFTWITARMTHVYCLGHLLGRSGDADLAAAGPERAAAAGCGTSESGGWFTASTTTARPRTRRPATPTPSWCSPPARPGLAALPGADDLLEEALAVWEERFFDADAGLFVDAWDRGFTRLDPYRGLNGNMHAVEALLAAADATGDETLRERALGIVRRVVHDFAEPQRLADPGALRRRVAAACWSTTPTGPTTRSSRTGPRSATAWSGPGCCCTWRPSLGDEAPDWLAPASVALFERAAADGWAVDGADGFVYTTDWDGRPVVRDRMHWVLAEGFAAAAALHQRTGEQRYADARPDLVGVRGTPPDRPRARLLAPPARRPERR